MGLFMQIQSHAERVPREHRTPYPPPRPTSPAPPNTDLLRPSMVHPTDPSTHPSLVVAHPALDEGGWYTHRYALFVVRHRLPLLERRKPQRERRTTKLERGRGGRKWRSVSSRGASTGLPSLLVERCARRRHADAARALLPMQVDRRYYFVSCAEQLLYYIVRMRAALRTACRRRRKKEEEAHAVMS